MMNRGQPAIRIVFTNISLETSVNVSNVINWLSKNFSVMLMTPRLLFWGSNFNQKRIKFCSKKVQILMKIWLFLNILVPRPRFIAVE